MNKEQKIVYETIVSRRSIRDFNEKPISDKEMEVILECADYAPSAGNLKSRNFLVIKDSSVIHEISSYIFPETKLSDPKYFKHAKVFVVMVAKVKECRNSYKRGKLYSIMGTSLAGQNMMLMAHSMNIGSCWIGQVKEKALVKSLNLTSGHKIVGIIAFGKFN